MHMRKLLTAAFLPAALIASAASAQGVDRADRREASNICKELSEQEGIQCSRAQRTAIADLVSVFRARPAPVSDLDVEVRHHEFENALRVIIPRRSQ